MSLSPVLLEPIGVIHSCYKENFGIPRQAGLVPSASAILKIPKTDRFEVAVEGLTSFSHLWILFHFHNRGMKDWKGAVRPPRLGGRKKVGVFATRSPDRPNQIGLSSVKLEKIEKNSKYIEIHVKGGDFLDQTPLLDIKPYIPYCDAIPDARSDWVQGSPDVIDVCFSEEAERNLSTLSISSEDRILIKEILRLDPRPGRQKEDPSKSFGIWIKDLNVKWIVPLDNQVLVQRIETSRSPHLDP